MSQRFTIKQVEELLKAGKIRGYQVSEPAKLPEKPGGRKVSKHFKKGDKAKDFIAWNLLIWCQERKIVLEEEYKFHPVRKWRFDWAVVIGDLKIAIEYNGIMSDKSRHTTVTGYTGDMEKINAAMAFGWRVLQFTPLNYRDLIQVLNNVINQTQ